MVKLEWGTKRTCPKCSTRFYDLGNSEPCECVDCGTSFKVEPILKEKQSHVIQTKAMVKEADKSKKDEKGKVIDDEIEAILLPDDDDDMEKVDESVLGDVSLDDNNGDVAVVVDAGVVKPEKT